MNVGNGKPLHEIMASMLGGNKLEEDNTVVGKQDTSIRIDKEVKDPRAEKDSIDTANIIKSAPTRPDPNKKKADIDAEDVDGIADGVLVVTDPEISSEEFEEVADELQGIVDNTEAGELPFSDKYEGNYILSCPICGGTFVSETLLESGEDTCPICCKIPDAFVVNGKVEHDESAVEKEDIQDDIDHEENLEEPTEGEEELQEVEPEMEEPAEEEDPNKKESVNMEGNKLEETKKLQEDEYDDYIENEKALAKDYSERIKGNITQEARTAFYDLKDILDTESNDTSVDGFYFPSKAVAVIENSKTQHHLNGNMDLTVANILNMVDDNDSIEEAIDELFADYKADSAFSWADNFISILGKLSFDLIEDEDWEVYDWNYKEDSDGDIIEGAGKIGNQEFVFEASREDNMIDFYDFETGETLDITDDELCNYILDLLNGLEESKKVEGDLSKDFYGAEADKRTYNRLQNLDIYLEEYEQAVADKDESRIETAKSKIMGNIGYLIPALNIKGGARGLVEYIKNTEFDFENKFKETINTLNQFAEEYRKEYEESKKVEGKKLTEEYYEDGIYAEIEDALRDAGLDIQRYSDAGVLTRNLGWIVYNENGERADLSCDGTYLSESKKLTEGEDTREATEIFINGLDKAVNTQSIVNPECMDEFFQNAKGILMEVAENNDVLLESKEIDELDKLQNELRGVDVSKLSDEEYEEYKKKAEKVKELINNMYDFDKVEESKEKKEEYVETNGSVSPLNKDTFGSIKELEQYINDEGYEIMNDDTIPDNATRFELFDPRESDGNVYVFNLETKGNNIVAHYSAKESWNMNESKKVEEAINYEYLDSNDLDSLGSDAELITDLYQTLGKDVDETWDNVMADMDNEVLKIAEKDGNKYYVYDDGSLKGYSLGRASNNAPISKVGSLEECVSSKAVLEETRIPAQQVIDKLAGKENVTMKDIEDALNSAHPEASDETINQLKDQVEKGLAEKGTKVEEAKLEEDNKVVWSSEGDYVTDINDEGFRDWLEANGYDADLEGEDEETQEAILKDYLEMYNETDNEVIMEDWQENIIPMLERQLDDNDLMILLGTAQTWRGTGEAGKILRGIDEFESLAADYDIVRFETNEANDLTVDLVHHDGTHYMDLYTFNGDVEGVYNKLIELGINEFSNDEYEDFDDAYSYYDAGDFLDYLIYGHQDALKEFLVPLKWNW